MVLWEWHLILAENTHNIRGTNLKMCSKIKLAPKTEESVNIAVEVKDDRIKIDNGLNKDLKP